MHGPGFTCKPMHFSCTWVMPRFFCQDELKFSDVGNCEPLKAVHLPCFRNRFLESRSVRSRNLGPFD